jgi:sterol desaturase/sphingolipid hydroxylase (fatty acid hydroxylase superfamily)
MLLALVSLGLLLFGVLLERIISATPCPIQGVIFNIVYLIPSTVLQAVTVAMIAGGVVIVTNRLGGGYFVLPTEGWLLIPAVLAYTLVMDFGEYVFHRAQHVVPALWTMHSFHHSDEAMNISTATRHFWAEHAIKSLTIYLLVGLLFQANPVIVAIYGVIGLCNLFAHMNIRVGWGRGWVWLNSPQYHRVHRSALPVHQDKNFAALLPLFDWLGGTAYPPRCEEYPPTGLYDHDTPRHLLEALLWPIRLSYRKLFARSTATV